MNNLLTNRHYTIQGNWYEPERQIKEYKSVIKTGLWDTTSSAGDWSGWFIQKIGKRSYLITFNQEAISFSKCFNVYTSDIIASWEGDLTQEEIYSILTDYNS